MCVCVYIYIFIYIYTYTQNTKKKKKKKNFSPSRVQSRKTVFLEQAGRALSLPLYRPITANVHEFARATYCAVDFVTAKAFKPMPEVR